MRMECGLACLALLASAHATSSAQYTLAPDAPLALSRPLVDVYSIGGARPLADRGRRLAISSDTQFPNCPNKVNAWLYDCEIQIWKWMAQQQQTKVQVCDAMFNRSKTYAGMCNVSFLCKSQNVQPGFVTLVVWSRPLVAGPYSPSSTSVVWTIPPC